MPYKFRRRGCRRSCRPRFDVKDAVVAILNADHPMTVRQVFYQLVVRGAIEKTEEQQCNVEAT
jgi:hypothetical protein